MNIIYYYPKCSTCQKAIKHLESKSIFINKVDFVENKLSKDEISKIYENSNLDISDFFNKRGLLYKKYNLKEKLENMSLDEKLEMLALDGRMIRRPLLIYEGKVILGYKKDEYENLK